MSNFSHRIIVSIGGSERAVVDIESYCALTRKELGDVASSVALAQTNFVLSSPEISIERGANGFTTQAEVNFRIVGTPLEENQNYQRRKVNNDRHN